MKKIALALMLVAGTLAANAQTTFGVKAGANSSSFSHESSKSTWGFHAGLTMSNKVAPGWEVNSSLLYFQKGSKAPITKMKLDYIELAVLPSYVIPTLPEQALAIKVGPYVGYGLNGSTTTTLLGKEIKSSVNAFTLDRVNRFDFGLGLGASYRISKFELGVETRFGLLNVGEGESKNQNVLFSLGYNF